MFAGLQIGLNDLMQIIILYLGIYALIRFVRGTRSAQVLLGFCALVIGLLVFAYLLSFDVLARIVYFLLIYLGLGMVVVFQHEIRRALALVGGQRLFGRHDTTRLENIPEKLAHSLTLLSQNHIGTLVAVERGISLRGYEETGIRLQALISHELLVSILTPPLPLHDGGIIIRDGLISAAHCLFPLSSQSDLRVSGMRHRAAIGLSEETDAVVIVISEETGIISVAHNGRLHRYAEEKAEKVLVRWLSKAMPHQTRGVPTITEWFRGYFSRMLQGNGKSELWRKRYADQ